MHQLGAGLERRRGDDDAATISGLESQLSAEQGKVSDLESQLADAQADESKFKAGLMVGVQVGEKLLPVIKNPPRTAPAQLEKLAPSSNNPMSSATKDISGLERDQMQADDAHSKITPWSATYADVKNGPSTFGAGPYNYMPTTQNIHLRQESIGGTEGAVKGLEILGAGYDIIFGNPLGTDNGELDPGFRDPVVEHQFTYYHSWQESQNQPCGPIGGFMECPAGIRVRREFMCNHESRASEVASTKELQDELSKQASRSAEVGMAAKGGSGPVAAEMSASVSFSSSQGFKQSTSQMADESKEFFDTTTLCTEFYVTYKKTHKPVYDGGFATIAVDLSRTPFEDCNVTKPVDECSPSFRKYMNFFETYGTDVITAVEMGAKRIHRLEFTTKAVTEMKSEGLDVSKEAAVASSLSVAVAGQGGGANAGFSDKSAQSNSESSAAKTASKASNEYEFNVGGLPSSDWREWASGVADRVMPVRYEMSPLPSYLTKWPVEGTEKEGEGNLLPQYLSEALVSYSKRFGDASTSQSSQAAKQGLTVTGPNGEAWPALAYGILRDANGKRLSESEGGDFISKADLETDACKQLQWGGKGFQKIPVTVATIVYPGLGAFTPGYDTKRTVAVGLMATTGLKMLTYKTKDYAPDSVQLDPFMVTMITGSNLKRDGETSLALVFGCVTESSTPCSSDSNKYYVPKGEHNGVTKIKLSAFTDPNSPPALVVTASYPSGVFDRLNPSAFASVCGFDFCEHSGCWQARVGHGDAGFTFLATNTHHESVGWALVDASQQTATWSHNLDVEPSSMAVKVSDVDVKNKLIDVTKLKGTERSEAESKNAQTRLAAIVDKEPGYVTMKFRKPWQTPPACVASQVTPDVEFKMTDEDMFCTGRPRKNVTNIFCGKQSSGEWSVRTQASAKNKYAFAESKGKAFFGTLEDCKAQCLTQKVDVKSWYNVGGLGASLEPCVGFVRPAMKITKDEMEQEVMTAIDDDEIAKCEGVANIDDFDSGLQGDLVPEFNSYFLEALSNKNVACGDGSSVNIRGLSRFKMSLETGNKWGHATNRALSIICYGQSTGAPDQGGQTASIATGTPSASLSKKELTATLAGLEVRRQQEQQQQQQQQQQQGTPKLPSLLKEADELRVEAEDEQTAAGMGTKSAPPPSEQQRPSTKPKAKPALLGKAEKPGVKAVEAVNTLEKKQQKVDSYQDSEKRQWKLPSQPRNKGRVSVELDLEGGGAPKDLQLEQIREDCETSGSCAQPSNLQDEQLPVAQKLQSAENMEDF